MPTLTITKSYDDGNPLTEAMIDDVKNSIEAFVNTTKLGSDNLQASSVETSQIASTAVTTAKIANNAVTAAKLSSSGSTDSDRAVGTDHIKDSAVTTAKINDAAVTTAKINDGAITKAKLSSTFGEQISSSSGSYTTTSGTFADVTNLSCTITTTGRPVVAILISDGGGSGNSYVGNTATTTSGLSGGEIQILRDASVVSLIGVQFPAFANTFAMTMPPGSVFHIDPVSAGTYTYKVQLRAVGGTAAIVRCKLAVYEV